MAESYSTFDESEFPLVKITFNLKDPSPEHFMQFIDGQKKLLTRNKEFVLLMDARKVGFLSSEIRIMQGNFFKEYKEPLKKYCLGAVLLVSSPIVKMMLKGMMLIAPPPNNTIVCSNELEARKLADEMCKKKEIQIGSGELIT